MAETNEELLAQDECPRTGCIEVTGHEGPCSEDPVRLPARVARLEGELAEARQLAHTEAEQRVKLRAAIAAKDAALEEVADLKCLAGTGPVVMLAKARGIARAALSDTTGEGWLEVREQVRRALDGLAHNYHEKERHQGPFKDCNHLICVEACAALDALGGE